MQVAGYLLLASDIVCSYLPVNLLTVLSKSRYIQLAQVTWFRVVMGSSMASQPNRIIEVVGIIEKRWESWRWWESQRGGGALLEE